MTAKHGETRPPKRSRTSPTRSASSTDGQPRPGRRKHRVLPDPARLLPYAADAGAIEIHWSQQILDEMSRNLRKRFGFGPADTDRLEELMNAYIEYALIEVEPEDLATVQNVEMDAKDRHVLAATISVDDDILLTQNTKHFPRTWMTERASSS
ncbi:MAG TPA: PIN domain-containing protein [Mycobacterium sp.]